MKTHDVSQIEGADQNCFWCVSFISSYYLYRWEF